jgi:RecA-family ATPase
MEGYEDNEAERLARDKASWERAEEVGPPEMTDYKGDPIPEPQPLAEGEDPSKLTIAHAGTLLEMFRTEGAPKENTAWGCWNVWKPGALTLVVGTQQSFKSWSMFDLMLNAAEGKDWFGHALGHFDSIVYVSNEKSQQAVYERLWKVFEGHDKAADKVYVRHRGDRIHFGNDAWKGLVRFLQEDLAEQRVLLILDTLTSLAPPGYDENSLTHVSVVLDAIRDVQDEARIDVMLLHHLNALGQRPRGHTALDGEVDGFVRMNRRGRDVDEVLITFEPKDGLPSSGAYAFIPETGTFKRATGRALHVGNLVNVVRWYEERNNGEGITIKELRDTYYSAHRYDKVEQEVDRGVKELKLRREFRRSMLTNREANLVNVLLDEERQAILDRRKRDEDIKRDVAVQYDAEQAVHSRAEKAVGYMPPDDEDDDLAGLL